MDATEVKLGADGDASPIKINLKQNILAKPAVLGAIGGALVGLSLPISKRIAQRSVLRRYNNCVEKSDLENKKSLIPTHLKLGAMPTSQGAGIGLGLIWKF
jgi:hypothetical protein